MMVQTKEGAAFTDADEGSHFQKDHPLSFVLWENCRPLFPSFGLITAFIALGSGTSLEKLHQAESSNYLSIFIGELICEQQLIPIKQNKQSTKRLVDYISNGFTFTWEGERPPPTQTL